MATHSSILAWRTPGMEEPGGLLSMGLHRVGHDRSDLAAAAASICPSQTPNLSLSPLFSLGYNKFLFSGSLSLCFVDKFICVLF